MALVACKDCNAEISTDAKHCPKCGAINPAAYTGVRFAGLAYLVLLGAAFYWIWGLLTPDARTEIVTQAASSEPWPFTVPEVELLCQGTPPQALAKVDGRTYALSGSARSQAQEKGWQDGYEITKPNPDMPEVKMDYSDYVTRAQALCDA
ncbi:hypothetical protein AO946_23480 [Pseudomonas aeruginosa]|uniref:DUF2511 domain-containing protein n=1 Tax=Pseudomonas aeruginosa TaxID=287 RepID=UPI00071B3639|nr:DUF2511 domain-containing protein [Pseudomonas aeruginosa]KSG23130.1 hypothetical protein AO946_23480 [Pseudomonas aeruginosa]